jgi:hypothetical protein
LPSGMRAERKVLPTADGKRHPRAFRQARGFFLVRPAGRTRLEVEVLYGP